MIYIYKFYFNQSKTFYNKSIFRTTPNTNHKIELFRKAENTFCVFLQMFSYSIGPNECASILTHRTRATLCFM